MCDAPQWHRISGEALGRAVRALKAKKANDAVCESKESEWINAAYHTKWKMQATFYEWKMLATFRKLFRARLARALAPN